MNSRKCRLCRRERAKLFLKGDRCFTPKCPLEKNGGIPPGDHGIRSGLRPSSFGSQLREKQKMRRFYGVNERQFKNYFIRAGETKSNTAEKLIELLELRLDNVIYRFGLTPSRATARQLVDHGLVMVNGVKVTSPSFQVSIKDRIQLKTKAQKMPHIEAWLAKKDIAVPDWLERKGLVGQVIGLPGQKHLPADINIGLILEFYSR